MAVIGVIRPVSLLESWTIYYRSKEIRNQPEFGVSKRLFKSSAAVNSIASLITCMWQSRKRSLRLYDRDMALLPAIIER